MTHIRETSRKHARFAGCRRRRDRRAPEYVKSFARPKGHIQRRASTKRQSMHERATAATFSRCATSCTALCTRAKHNETSARRGKLSGPLCANIFLSAVPHLHRTASAQLQGWCHQLGKEFSKKKDEKNMSGNLQHDSIPYSSPIGASINKKTHRASSPACTKRERETSMCSGCCNKNRQSNSIKNALTIPISFTGAQR